MAEKQRYTVADGVAWVNGRRVPADRIVELTETEAAFDLGYARIAPTDGVVVPPADPQKAGRARTTSPAES